MLAGFLVVGWIVVNILSGPGMSLAVLLAPIAWCVRLSMRLTVLNSCLARGALAAENPDPGLIAGAKPTNSESRGGAELPDVSDE